MHRINPLDLLHLVFIRFWGQKKAETNVMSWSMAPLRQVIATLRRDNETRPMVGKSDGQVSP